ncbi:MAG: site-2 protease family protein [Azoarcus sp.]|jgi:Zn-dependent protease|nr:site-2 protease family protein [Azoarcus sp.]
MLNTIAEILIWVIPVLLAITVHEAAHGYVARYFGDPTAERAGRITLNPLRHIDPMGTIVVPLLIYISSSMAGSPMAFGWAKPVPVNFARLRNPKADMLWVAAAGPFSNLVMATGWALLYSLAPRGVPIDPYAQMALVGVGVNGVLLFLNLLPIPPLDGGRIVVSLLPERLAWKFARIEPYGFPILILLIATGALDLILGPLLNSFRTILMMLFGR